MNRRLVVSRIVSVALLLCTANGCVGADDGASSAHSNITASTVPTEIGAAAAELKLGASKGPMQGAAGHAYYDFERATIAYNDVLKQIDSVKFHDPTLDLHGENDELTGDVLKATLNFGLGAFQREDSAAGSSYFTFEEATVRYNGVEKALVDVTWEKANLGVLSGDTLAAAVSLELGHYQSSQGAAGTGYFEFDRGQIEFSNSANAVHRVTVKDATLEGSKEVALPGDVVKSAVQAGFGRLVGSQGAAGTYYYEFVRGTVAYNAQRESVVSVTPKGS